MAKLTHKKRVTRKKTRKVYRGGVRGPRTGVLINLDKIRAKDPNPYVLEMNENETHNVFGPNPASVVKSASQRTMRGKMGSLGSSMKKGFSSLKNRFSRKKAPAPAPVLKALPEEELNASTGYRSPVKAPAPAPVLKELPEEELNATGRERAPAPAKKELTNAEKAAWIQQQINAGRV